MRPAWSGTSSDRAGRSRCCCWSQRASSARGVTARANYTSFTATVASIPGKSEGLRVYSGSAFAAGVAAIKDCLGWVRLAQPALLDAVNTRPYVRAASASKNSGSQVAVAHGSRFWRCTPRVFVRVRMGTASGLGRCHGQYGRLIGQEGGINEVVVWRYQATVRFRCSHAGPAAARHSEQPPAASTGERCGSGRSEA